tara:strand:- start:5497 stop:6264 length:768 start_codon:yes stop_codon:yes gene_type:complete
MTNNSVLDEYMSWSWFEFNDSACNSVDNRIDQLIESSRSVSQHREDPSSIIVPTLVILASSLCLFAGARLLRFTAAFAAAGFAFYAVYSFGRTASERITCEALIIISSVIAAVAAVSAGCIYKAGLFFVGAAAMIFLVHLVFSTFPELHYMGDQPMLANKSLAYWGMMLVAGVAGGLVLRWHSVPALEVVTACVGGAGVAYSLRAIAAVADAGVHGWVFMVCGLCAALLGAVVQRQLRLRGCKRRETNTDTIPRM